MISVLMAALCPCACELFATLPTRYVDDTRIARGELATVNLYLDDLPYRVDQARRRAWRYTFHPRRDTPGVYTIGVSVTDFEGRESARVTLPNPVTIEDCR